MAKEWRGSVRLSGFAFAVLVLCLFGVSSAQAGVGRTPGSFNVSSSGAANYNIPIFTPPGPRGMQPKISLAYNSNGDGGLVGLGWSLSGLSSISRCNKTIAQDGVAESGTAYCVNGNKLRLQSGTFGANGSTYATEVADFSRITLVGTIATTGYWVVEGKDGLTYTYGGATNARPQIQAPPTYASSTVQWMLNEVSDRSGNKIVVTWALATGTSHPTKIEWTQTSLGSGSYLYSMEFSYGTNTPSSDISYHRFGGWVYDAALLTGITVKESGTVKRNYVLTYDTSPTTGAKRLTEVEECSDGAATDCLSPTVITYQNGTAGVDLSSPLLNISGSISGAYGKYDFSGDGIKDLAYNDGGTWYVRLGSATSGYSSAINTGASYILPGKLLGNHADQFLADSGGTWHVYDWNGASFSATSTGISSSTTTTNLVLSDINGDGRDDLVYATGTSPYIIMSPQVVWTRVHLSVQLNASTGGSVSFASPVNSQLYTQDSPFLPNTAPPGWTSFTSTLPFYRLIKGGDVDGDGSQELGIQLVHSWCFMPMYDCAGADEYRTITFNGGPGNASPSNPQSIFMVQNYTLVPYSSAVSSVDFNNDGCDDFILYSANAIGLSNCDLNWYHKVYSTFSTMYNALPWFIIDPGPVAIDWDGNGRKDFVNPDVGGSYLEVTPNFDTTTGSPISSGIPVCLPFTTDGNGDGLDDFGCMVPGSGLVVYGHNNTNGAPDLAAEFEDGFGVSFSPTYTEIERSNYTGYSNASYPYQDVRSDRRVVAEVEATDGIGGTYTTTYEYFGAQVNLEGRGFVGFEKIEAVDSRNSTVHVRKFKREFPYSGMAAEDLLYQPGGTTPISSKVVTAAYYTLDPTPYNERVYPYVSTLAEDTYEVGGAKDGQLIKSVAITNTYDTSGNQTASTSVVTDKDSGSPYYNQTWTTASSATFSPNTTYWCLGLPATTSVTSSTSVSGESSVTRSQDMTVDYINCRHTAVDVEPSGGNRRVQTSYGFDGFGNINSVSVTGRHPNGNAMTARTSGISWGTTGQFPVAETNALSQTTSRTFHSTFGSLVTETDPNGIVVANNEYDAFGRITRSIRADGTATRMTHAACATYGCENGDPGSGATGINKMIVIASERDTGDTQVRDSWTYLDQFDRPIVQKARTVTGGYSRSGTQYDALGRVFRQTAPCDASSCTAYWITTTYDLLGRVETQSRPQSQSVSTPVSTTFSYAGRTQTITDPQSKFTTKILDVNGWMRRSEDHNGYYQSFSYDAAGSLKEVTDSLSNPLFSATYSYGIQAFQDSTTDMDLGTWSYSYNSLGERVAWTDAKSNTFSQTFDALSRVTARTDNYEGITTTWTWGTSSGSKNIGRLAGVSMTGYSESFSYDSVGRPSTQTVTTDQAYAVDYAYTSQGLLDTLTYPTSTSSTRVKVKYGYDYGILKSVTDWTSGSAGTVYWTANAKNVRGQTTQETLGNGVVTNRAFDAVTGWLNSIQSGPSGGAGLQNQSYLYDLVGNITQRQESTLGLTENFYYDDLYRLDYSQLNSSTNLDLTYDAMGNITARSDVNGGASWTYHSTRKHAVAMTGSGGVSFSYDANGNMTDRAGSTITWASYNYPTGLATGTESAMFYYGPDRQYYRQEYSGPSGNESTYYVGGILEKVTSGGVTDWRHYIRAEGQVVAIVSRLSTSSNDVYYPLEDNQGSGSHLTSSGGSSLARQSYTAFGLPRDGADWDGAVPGGDQTTINGISRRGYTGHSMLGSMGLIHMNGRVQDAITGRFLSPDPNIPDPGFTQSFNRYAYVVNNPLSQIDPTGFMNAFMQEICSSGVNPWSPEMDAMALGELCFRHMSFTEASENGTLVNIALQRQAGAGCPVMVVDCDMYHDRRIQTQRENRQSTRQGIIIVEDIEYENETQRLPAGGLPIVGYSPNGTPLYEEPLVQSFIGIDDLINEATGGLLELAGCTGDCQVAFSFLLGGRLPGRRFSTERQALTDMAEMDKRAGGITRADMQAYKDLNASLPDPYPTNKVRGPEAHQSGGPHSRQPHGHVGPVGHIPIIDP